MRAHRSRGVAARAARQASSRSFPHDDRAGHQLAVDGAVVLVRAGSSNLTAYVPLPVMVLLLAKLGEPTDWTLCGRDPVHVQVTVLPIGMVSTAALLLPLWPLTNWMPGPAVTEPAGPPPPPPPPPRHH